MNGPYESESDARAELMPREVSALHGSGRARPGDAGRVALHHLLAACDECGVELGAFDRRTLAWLAGREDVTAQVVIGLVRRAYRAGIERR